MDAGSYEARKSGAKERVEVTLRTERRRRWTPEEKLGIVRETLRPGAVAHIVAEQHGIGTGLLYTWRKQMLTAAMTGFAAVEVAPTSEVSQLPAPSLASSAHVVKATLDIAVEVDLPSGARVRVGKSASAALLSSVFAALDQR